MLGIETIQGRRLSHNLFVSSPQLWDESTCNFTPKIADWSQTEITSYIKLYMETVTWMNVQRDLVRPPNSFHLWPIQIWSQFLIITIVLKKTILKQFIQSIPWSMHSITFRHLLFSKTFFFPSYKHILLYQYRKNIFR